MSDTVLVGRGRELSTIPRNVWEDGLKEAPRRIESRLAFMSEEHHRVRNFAVAELPRRSRPIPPAEVSRVLGIPLSKTLEILTDLEKNLFFLVRDENGQISWAFPVTADSTGHSLSFSTGERLDAA